jgi:tripartite-type tricarboxylate transporter receptor subunit TctC
VIARRPLLLAAASAILPGGARAVQRAPIMLLVGSAAESEFDRMARTFAEFLRPHLYAIDVRNLPGDAGRTMLTALGEAVPDGATIGWVVTPTLGARMIDRNDPDLIRRLILVGQVEREPIAFVSPARDPVESVQDIIRRAGEDADVMPLGTPPAGSPPHLAALRLQGLAQTRLSIITFPSSAAARQAVLAGNVSAAALGLSAVIGDVRDGSLTAIGIAAKRRFGMLPDAPILDEAGIPLSAFIRRGIAVPAGTPQSTIATLAEAIHAVTEDEAFHQQAESGGYHAAWADAASWRSQMEIEQAALAKLWQTDPWLSSSSG